MAERQNIREELSDHGCFFIDGCGHEADPCAECSSGKPCPGLKMRDLICHVASNVGHVQPSCSMSETSLVQHDHSAAQSPCLSEPCCTGEASAPYSEYSCSTSPNPSDKRRRRPIALSPHTASVAFIWRSITRRMIFHATAATEAAGSALARGSCGGCAQPPLKSFGLPMISVWRVQRHRGAEDCWLAAHGAVYDVTLFLKRHPGGERVLLKRAGSDCSEDFDFHSAAGRRMWDRFRIGVLAPLLPALSGVERL